MGCTHPVDREIAGHRGYMPLASDNANKQETAPKNELLLLSCSPAITDVLTKCDPSDIDVLIDEITNNSKRLQMKMDEISYCLSIAQDHSTKTKKQMSNVKYNYDVTKALKVIWDGFEAPDNSWYYCYAKVLMSHIDWMYAVIDKINGNPDQSK